MSRIPLQLKQNRLNHGKIKITNQLENVGGQEGETILVTERLIIHVCGESRRKHGAVIRIAALKSTRIIFY